MALLWFGLLLAATVWVAADAGKRDWSNDKFARRQTIWIVGMVLLAVIVFPIYLFRRGRAPRKGSAGGTGGIGAAAASYAASPGTYVAPPSLALDRLDAAHPPP